jgi:hypothetical protein
MSWLDSIRNQDNEDSILSNLAQTVAEENETIAIIEPFTSGMLTHQLTKNAKAGNIVGRAYIPQSTESFQEFASLRGNEPFPQKELANEEDIQNLSYNLVESTGADHSIVNLGYRDGKKYSVWTAVELHKGGHSVWRDDQISPDNRRSKGVKISAKVFWEVYQRDKRAQESDF